MRLEAYKKWTEIFDDDVAEIWNTERKELKKSSMLLTAFQKELKKVYTAVEVELTNLRVRLNHKDKLNSKKQLPTLFIDCEKSAPDSNNKENVCTLNQNDPPTTPVTNTDNVMQSPDFFKYLEKNASFLSADTSVIDLSISDEEVNPVSPTISNRKKYLKRHRSNASNIRNELEKCDQSLIRNRHLGKYNSGKSPDDDSSIIERTPELEKKKNASKVAKWQMERKTHCKEATIVLLTPTSPDLSKRKLVNDKEGNGIDPEETYFEGNREKSMGITQILNYINEDETILHEEMEVDNSVDRVDHGTDLSIDLRQEIKHCKDVFLKEPDIIFPAKKPKIMELLPEPVVRGDARKKLQGYACQDCEKFYEFMNLPANERKKQMNKCSKHRFKYRPPDETVQGFWELAIPSPSKG